jgi:hypothetical protein
MFRDRYIIWVCDEKGGSGKSEFIKWLRTGQKTLEVRKVPIDSVDRLTSAVVTVTKAQKIDLFLFDDTRTKGKDTSYDDMFEAIENIKNGHVVSCMYGKYMESIFRRPMIIFFTNKPLLQYQTSLSIDRWFPTIIRKGELVRTNTIGTTYSHLGLPSDIPSVEEIITKKDCKNLAGNKILTNEDEISPDGSKEI